MKQFIFILSIMALLVACQKENDISILEETTLQEISQAFQLDQLHQANIIKENGTEYITIEGIKQGTPFSTKKEIFNKTQVICSCQSPSPQFRGKAIAISTTTNGNTKKLCTPCPSD